MSKSVIPESTPYNFTTNLSGGGVLTEDLLNKHLDAMRKAPEWSEVPVVWLTAKQIRKLKKKYPEMFERDFNCSWRQLEDAIREAK